MAVTAKDLLLIIRARDHASRQLRQLGENFMLLDQRIRGASGGFKEANQGFGAAARAAKDFDTQMGRTNRRLGDSDRHFFITRRHIVAFADALHRSHPYIRSFAAAFVLPTLFVKFAAILAPVIGLISAVPGLLAPLVQGFGVAALGMLGINKALDASAKLWRDTKATMANFRHEMDMLPSVAKRLVVQIRGLKDEFNVLRGVAAAGILPEVSEGINRTRVLFPLLRNVIRDTAITIGRLIDMASRLVTSPAWRRDLAYLGKNNADNVGRFGRTALNLSDALRNVMVVAQPLVNWLSRLAERWSEQVMWVAEDERRTGALSQRLLEARDRLLQIFRIVNNVIQGFKSLANALTPLGGDFLTKIERFTEEFRTFARTIENANPKVRQIVSYLMVAAGIAAFPGVTQLVSALIRLAATGGPIGLVVSAVTLLGVAGIIAYNKFEPFRRVVQSVGNFIKTEFIPAIQRAIPFVRDQLQAGIRDVTRAFQENKQEILIVGRFLLGLAKFIAVEVIPVLFRLWAVHMRQWLNAMAQVVRGIGVVVRGIRGFVNAIVGLATAVFTNVTRMLGGWNQLSLGVGRVLARIRSAISTNWRVYTSIILGVIRGWPRLLLSIGTQMMRDLVRGWRSINLISVLRQIVGGAIDWVKRILKLGSPSRLFFQFGQWSMEGFARGIKNQAPKIFDSFIGSINPNLIARVIGNLTTIPASLMKRLGSLFAGVRGAIGRGNIWAWASQAAMITGVPSWIPAIVRRAMFESGGNPRAINLWDINAARGTPSKGIMQTIDPTFRAYALPFMRDIWNPVHNMVAAIRYIKSRYGTIWKIDPPVRGYARGSPYIMEPTLLTGLRSGRQALMSERRPERVQPMGEREGNGAAIDYDLLAMAIVRALDGGISVAVDDIHKALLRKKGTRWGGIKLGLE